MTRYDINVICPLNTIAISDVKFYEILLAYKFHGTFHGNFCKNCLKIHDILAHSYRPSNLPKLHYCTNGLSDDL